jgi:hypothetical protein
MSKGSVATASPPQSVSAAQSKQLHELVAKRAYEKWCKRGRPCGTHLQDWFEAEQEVMKEMGTSQRR